MTRQLPTTAAFGHALSSVRNNLDAAFRISWPWYAVVVPVSFVVFGLLEIATGGDAQASPGLRFVVGVLVGVLTMISAASIAVNWHRYILRDEVPRGREVLRIDDLVWRYFGNVLLIMLAMLATTLVIAIPLNLIAALGQSPGFGIVTTILIGLPIAGTLFFRLAVKLPAVALGRDDFSMRDAWQKTRDNNVPIFLLFLLNLLVGIGALILAFAVQAFFSLFGVIIGGLAAVIVQLAVNWMLTILGITILTSLYGFFVENREF